MADRDLERRVRILEEKVTELQELPARVAAVESQILHLRAEMQGGFSALRAANEETRAEMVRLNGETRAEMVRLNDETRAEMVRLNAETQAQMRVLHEEVIARLALLQEGRASMPRKQARPPRAKKS
jgi:hypothetical protein